MGPGALQLPGAPLREEDAERPSASELRADRDENESPGLRWSGGYDDGKKN